MNVVLAEIDKLRASPMARNAGWLFAGQGLGLVLQAAYFIMLARLMGPVQYGIYAGAFAFANLVAQYSALGTGTVFLRYVSSDHSAFAVYWGNILAVTMVVGNNPKISTSLFAPGYTIASVLANEFTEATGDLYTSSLIELGLVLFALTIVINGAARILVASTTSRTGT